LNSWLNAAGGQIKDDYCNNVQLAQG